MTLNLDRVGEMSPEKRNKIDALNVSRQSPGVPRDQQVPPSKLSTLIPKGPVMTGMPKKMAVKR